MARSTINIVISYKFVYVRREKVMKSKLSSLHSNELVMIIIIPVYCLNFTLHTRNVYVCF